jgi:HSP20 family protein
MFDTILARDIRQTLDEFRRSVDQLFSSFDAGRSAGTSNNTSFTLTPVVESFWTGHKVLLRAVIPGVTDKDVSLSVQNGRIVVEGERKAPEGWGENARTLMTYGKFHTAIPLPNGLDLDKVSCRLHNGVLDIEVPVAEQMKPRQIPINSADSQRTIAASV